jgi:tryptophan synthase alpha subunit
MASSSLVKLMYGHPSTLARRHGLVESKVSVGKKGVLITDLLVNTELPIQSFYRNQALCIVPR